MKIEPAVTWVGAAIIMMVGVFIAGCGAFLALRGERSAPVATFVLLGVAFVGLGASQLAGPPLRGARKTDKPLDKASAPRHLAGPGRTWRPR